MNVVGILIKTCLMTAFSALLLGIFSFISLKIVGSKEVRVPGMTVMNVFIFVVMLVVYMMWAGMIAMLPEVVFFKKALFPVLGMTFLIALVIGVKTFGYVSWGRALLASIMAVILPVLALYLLMGSQIKDPGKLVEIVTNPMILFK